MANVTKETVTQLVYAGHKSLKGLDLSGLDLSGLELQDVDFTGCNLIKTQFAGANLKGAKLDKVNAAYANFNKATLDDASLNNSHLAHAHFAGTKARGARFIEADLHEVRMEKDTAAGVSTWLGSWFPAARLAGVEVSARPLIRPKAATELDQQSETAAKGIVAQQLRSDGRRRFSTLTRNF